MFMFCINKGNPLNWIACIAHNRDALLRMVAMWSVMLCGKTLTRRTQFAVMRVLRSAESAVRRLVMIEARELAQVTYRKRAAPAGPIPKGVGDAERLAPFSLFDPRKNFGLTEKRRFARAPRIGFFDAADALGRTGPPPEVTLDDPVDAARLLRRLASLKAALESLPKQAKRLRRAQARRSAGPKRLMGPMRPGWPPGYRARGKDEIDEILRDCQTLAQWALRPVKPPDTG